MPGFPESIQALYIARGLWLRVRVLDLPAALTGKDAIRVAVSAALGAMEPEQPEQVRQPTDESARVHLLAKHARAVAGVARQAVIGHAWSEMDEAAEQEHAARLAAVHDAAAEGYRLASAAHAAAVAAAGDDPAVITAAGEALAQEIARIDAETVAAVETIGPFAPGQPPQSWQPITIVPNPQDEDRPRGKYAVATLDQVAVEWSYKVSDVALRAVWEARSVVRPLSPTAKP